MDLCAVMDEAVTLQPMERAVIPTGVGVALPQGYEAQIRSRSGLSCKHGLVVLNAPGTIDADYRGEIKAIMINLGQEAFTITPGLRIAQMVIAPYIRASWTEVKELDETARGHSGFGSTGMGV
jgi:dUTP pyrophosphatase